MTLYNNQYYLQVQIELNLLAQLLGMVYLQMTTSTELKHVKKHYVVTANYKATMQINKLMDLGKAKDFLLIRSFDRRKQGVETSLIFNVRNKGSPIQIILKIVINGTFSKTQHSQTILSSLTFIWTVKQISKFILTL